MSAGGPGEPQQDPGPAAQAGVTRRQFVMVGGIVAGVAAARRVAPPEVDFIGRVLAGASSGA